MITNGVRRVVGRTAADLAADLGVSKSTVLEHLRKAEARLLDP